jgi:DNA-binding beta-propeller fold protein YncE
MLIIITVIFLIFKCNHASSITPFSTPSVTPSASTSVIPNTFSVIAGRTTNPGWAGDGRPAVLSFLHTPLGLAFDPTGTNLFVADSDNSALRIINATSGIITNYAKQVSDLVSDMFTLLSTVVVDSYGNVYIMGMRTDLSGYNTAYHLYFTASVDLGVSIGSIQCMGYHPSGFIYANFVPGGQASTGVVSLYNATSKTIRGIGFNGYICYKIASDINNYVWAQCRHDFGLPLAIMRADPSGNTVLNVAYYTLITACACDNLGNFYFSDTALRKMDVSGNIQTIATPCVPQGLAFDPSGNLYFSCPHMIQMMSLAAGYSFPTPSSTSTPYCFPAQYQTFTNYELIGTLVGTAFFPGSPIRVSSEASCRQACCDAVRCDGYTFEIPDQQTISILGGMKCLLLINITQLVPSTLFTSAILNSTL